MNKLKHLIPLVAIGIFAACSPATQTTEQAKSLDSRAVSNQPDSISSLSAKIFIAGEQQLGKPIEMTFTVYNNTDSALTFCKWHTPFEALMSKYLDINSVDGKEVSYKGPMAKRIMPPPADSYISVAAKDSLSIKVDLTRGYDFNRAGTYIVGYNSTNISGLKLTDSVKFTLK